MTDHGDGKRRQAKALIEHRPEAPNIKHGVPAFMQSGIHPCDKCVKQKVCDRFKKGSDCSYLAEYQQNIESFVMDLDYVEAQDRPLVQLLAKEMATVALCEMYFSVEGMVIHDKRKKTLGAQALVTTYNEAKKQAKQTMQALGIGPAARARLTAEQLNTRKQINELGLDDKATTEGTEFLDD